MKKLILVFFMCFTTHSYALEVAGVKLDEQLMLDTHQLVLNGAGIGTEFFFKVYVAGLYLGEKIHTSAGIMENGGAKKLLLYMLRDIRGKDMFDAINDVIPANHSAEEMKVLDTRLQKLSRIFTSVNEIKKGEVIVFDYFPAAGTRLTVGGVEWGYIDGLDFNRALLKVWVGEKPAQASLKQSLLGVK